MYLRAADRQTILCSWRQQSLSVAPVFVAMAGNEDGISANVTLAATALVKQDRR
jgi:hypothetical protein